MLKTIGLTVLFLLIMAVLVLGVVGIEPKDRRPGTRLAGELTAIPADWSMLADFNEVQLETHPWYGIPFSVTVVIVNDRGVLYVPSIYAAALPFPGTKYWNKVVERNPLVRLRVGTSLYEMSIRPVLDAAEDETALAAFGRNSSFWQEKIDAGEIPRKFALLRLESVRLEPVPS